MPTVYCIVRYFVFITDEVPISQEDIHFTDSKQIGKYSIHPELCDPCLFNGWRRLANIIVVVNVIVVKKLVQKLLGVP